MNGLVAWLHLALLCGAAPAEAAPDAASRARPTGEARAQLQEILQRPLYQRWKLRHERASATRSAWRQQLRDVMQSMFQGIGAWLERMFSGWGGWSPSWGGIPSIGSILKVTGWTVLALVLGYLAVTAYRLWLDPDSARARSRVLSREQVHEALEQGAALALSPGQWLQQAGQLARDGDFRPVYRALYLALLSGLHAAGKIEYRPQRTNWVYVARFRGPDDQRRSFHDLTALFDEVWYGLKPARGADLDSLRRTIGGLIDDTVA